MADISLNAEDGGIESSDGWAVHVLGPELIEYVSGAAACLVNVAYSSSRRAYRIYATESLSELFPDLLEHLQSAAGMLHGRYEVV